MEINAIRGLIVLYMHTARAHKRFSEKHFSHLPSFFSVLILLSAAIEDLKNGISKNYYQQVFLL
jgi:hypothetical protein